MSIKEQFKIIRSKSFLVFLRGAIIGVVFGAVASLEIVDLINNSLGGGLLGSLVGVGVGNGVGGFIVGWSFWMWGPREILIGADKGGWGVAVRTAMIGLIASVCVGGVAGLMGNNPSTMWGIWGAVMFNLRFYLIASKKEDKKDS